MAIKGLTDKGASFPQLGTIRKGGKKPDTRRPGPDLHFFRFVTDDALANRAFIETFGDEPEEINILLPFPTVDENFQAWKEDWVASSLKHRCDGETCVLHQVNGRYSQEPIPCPGGCKQVGRLKVIIPAFQRFAYITVTTTSIWDIINIHENLSALQALRGDLRGIPLILRRKYREISTPAEGGKRARRKKSLITIEANPDWVKLELASQQQKALPSIEPLALNAAPIAFTEAEVEEEEIEMMEIGEAPYDDKEDDEPAVEMSERDVLLAELLDICEEKRPLDGFVAEMTRQVGAFETATGKPARKIQDLSEAQLRELKTGIELYLKKGKTQAASA